MSEEIIKNAEKKGEISDKSRLAAFLLAFFLGGFGVHRFYVGRVKSGVIMLILTLTIIGAIISGIWATIDWIFILLGDFEDEDGKKLKKW